MATSEAKEIKKQETLVRFSIISYKTRLRVKAVKYTKVMLVSCKLQTNREIGCVEGQIFDLPRCSAASSQSAIFFVRLEVSWQFGHMSKRVTIPSRIIFPSLCLNEFIRCFHQFVSLIFLHLNHQNIRS